MRRLFVEERSETAVKRRLPTIPTALRRLNQFSVNHAPIGHSLYHLQGSMDKGLGRAPYDLSGISFFASTNVFRGIQTTRSSGPHPAEAGRFGMASPVMSRPMTAKSPESSSKISGQPPRQGVCAPLACGSGPSRRLKTIIYT